MDTLVELIGEHCARLALKVIGPVEAHVHPVNTSDLGKMNNIKLIYWCEETAVILNEDEMRGSKGNTLTHYRFLDDTRGWEAD